MILTLTDVSSVESQFSSNHGHRAHQQVSSGGTHASLRMSPRRQTSARTGAPTIVQFAREIESCSVPLHFTTTDLRLVRPVVTGSPDREPAQNPGK